MDKISLNNIKITKLKRINTNSGDVLKIINKDDKCFTNFGEAYFSWVNFNAIKAWKIHQKMTLNLVVPLGKVKFVFFIPDQRNKFKTVEIGDSKDSYKRITVPPKICFGFKGLAKQKSLILNIANIKHSDKESIKYDLDYCKYDW
jgi:dTDP-4-dehydrorhamnose 3,5-epimerase